MINFSTLWMLFQPGWEAYFSYTWPQDRTMAFVVHDTCLEHVDSDEQSPKNPERSSCSASYGTTKRQVLTWLSGAWSQTECMWAARSRLVLLLISMAMLKSHRSVFVLLPIGIFLTVVNDASNSKQEVKHISTSCASAQGRCYAQVMRLKIGKSR